MTASPPDARTPLARAAGSPETRTWLFIVAMAAAAAVLTLTNQHGSYLTHPHVPWWVIPPATAIAVTFVIQLDFRREVHLIHLSQVPLVVALFFLPPQEMVPAVIGGAAAAYFFVLRLPIQKAVFNVILMGLTATVAATVFWPLIPAGADIGPRSWPAAFAATLVDDVLSGLLLSVVILIHERWSIREMAQRVFGFSLAVTLVATSLAIVGITSFRFEASTGWALALFAALGMWAARGYHRLSTKHAALNRLYEFTRGLGPVAHDTDDIAPALDEVRHLLHADHLDLALVGDTATFTRISVSADTVSTDVHIGDPVVLDDITAGVLRTGEAALQSRPKRPLWAGWHTTPTPAADQDHISVAVGTGGAPVGVLQARHRSTEFRGFDRHDLELLEAVASQLSTALERGRLLESLRRAATRDSLTDIANLDTARATINQLVGGGRPGCVVLLLDLDHFQDVNDTLGHDAGDVLLQETARRLTQAAPDGATAARVGADQFLLILREAAGSETARLAALAVKSRVDGPLRLAELSADIRVTVGIARAPEHGSDAGVLLRRAELAMMAAKGTSSGLAEWEPEHERGGPRRLALVTGLRQALVEGGLTVMFQPKLQLGSGRVVGMEALVRWRHDELGSVPPSEFVPLAEASGLIGALTTNVLRQALENCRRWQDSGTPVGVAVNLSTRSLTDPLLLGQVAALLTATQVEPQWLTLEITESSVMDNPTRSVEVLRQLRMLGVRLSIDDFGTGYSSLNYVKGLPVHELKVDKSFVDAIVTDPTDRAVVRAIIELSRSLGLVTVAEGVEEAEQALALDELGLDEVQGYFYAKPMEPEDAAAWLRTRPVAAPSA